MGEIEDLITNYAGTGYAERLVAFKEVKPSTSLFTHSIVFLTRHDSGSKGNSHLELHSLDVSKTGYALVNYPCSKQSDDYRAEKIQPIYDAIKESADFAKIKGSKLDFELES